MRSRYCVHENAVNFFSKHTSFLPKSPPGFIVATSRNFFPAMMSSTSSSSPLPFSARTRDFSVSRTLQRARERGRENEKTQTRVEEEKRKLPERVSGLTVRVRAFHRPVEPLQNGVVGQGDLVHQKHSFLFHREHQGSVAPFEQTAVFGVRL